MATQITTTSELQAIYTMLSIIGEAPVSSITTDIGSDVSIAKQILDESSVSIQTKRWNFNTEESFSLAQDSNNKVPVPSNCVWLTTRISDSPLKVVIRNGFLYNKEKHTDVFSAAVLVDMIILFSIILLALSFHFELIWNLLKEKQASMIRPLYWFFGGLIPVIYVIRFLFKQERHPAIIKIKNFLKGLTEGILSLKKMPKKGVFIAHTLFIWIMYIAMFYVVKWAVPETSTLGLNALLPAFVIGGLAISASNGSSNPCSASFIRISALSISSNCSKEAFIDANAAA